jgi:hypothetical protein
MDILVSVCGSFSIKVFQLVKLYSYLLVGSLTVFVADTVVEGANKDG